MSESWMLDEMAHAGPEHLDDDFIARYDKKRDNPARRRTSRHSSPAADVSPAMLAALRKKAAAAGAANLEIVRAGFLSYDHAGPPADGVFTRNALHQIPDFWKGIALTRIAGILRPGGVLRLRPSLRLPAGRGRRGLRCLVRGRRQGPG